MASPGIVGGGASSREARPHWSPLNRPVQPVITVFMFQCLCVCQITTDTGSSFTYCGEEVPETLTLNATTVELTFVSDFAVTEKGFKIQYKLQSESSTGIGMQAA